MRKRKKVKKKSCPLCKPHKMGWDNRWEPKDEQELKLFEKKEYKEDIENEK